MRTMVPSGATDELTDCEGIWWSVRSQYTWSWIQTGPGPVRIEQETGNLYGRAWLGWSFVPGRNKSQHIVRRPLFPPYHNLSPGPCLLTVFYCLSSVAWAYLPAVIQHSADPLIMSNIEKEPGPVSPPTEPEKRKREYKDFGEEDSKPARMSTAPLFASRRWLFFCSYRCQCRYVPGLAIFAFFRLFPADMKISPR